MAITYDVPSDTITVTGYTEGTPCNFTDIFNADVGGGWGQVTLQGTTQFEFTCKLIIGDGSTETWFADTLKQASFINAVSGNTQIIISVTTNATFRLGILEVASKHATSNGCQLVVDDSTYWGYLISDQGGIVSLYSSSFLSVGSQSYNINNDVTIWNCVLHRVQLADSTGDYFNVTYSGEKDIWNMPLNAPISGTYDKITAYHCGYASSIWNSATFSNLFVQDNIDAFIFQINNLTVYIIDCIFDSWGINWNGKTNCFVYRQQTVNLEVSGNGKIIKDASTILYNADGTEAFNTTTAVDGTITEQTVSRGCYDNTNGNTLQDYGPFKLVISKTGFDTYTHPNITLDEPVDWRITLSPPQHGQMQGQALTKHDLSIQLLQTIRKHYEARTKIESGTVH